MELTERQKEVLEFIYTNVKEKGYPPTVREIGEEFSPITKKITRDTIMSYADATKDYNPIHVDEEFAKKTPFKGIIAHGLTSVAFISELMTREFFRGWLFGGKVDMRFRAPIKPGDTITLPPGLAHNAKNISDEEAVLFIAFSSADRETREE